MIDYRPVSDNRPLECIL